MSHPDNYQRILQSRHDMTQWLLHFTHARYEDDGSFGGKHISPKEVLLEILSTGHLKPGWSPRGGKRTIYGPRPAVCFSEMTLLSFCEYLRARDDTAEPISGYGIILHKLQAFSAGALPVIYDKVEDESTGANGERTADIKLLPHTQQFRLVRTDLYSGNGFSDWTHEREWRWPRTEEEQVLRLTESHDWRVASRGRPHVFVRYDHDIKDVQKETCAKIGNLPTEYVKCLSGSGIISLETVERETAKYNKGFCRLEDWPADVDLLMSPGKKELASNVFIHPVPR